MGRSCGDTFDSGGDTSDSGGDTCDTVSLYITELVALNRHTQNSSKTTHANRPVLCACVCSRAKGTVSYRERSLYVHAPTKSQMTTSTHPLGPP